MSDSLTGAVIEVLQDLRQNAAAREVLDELEGDDVSEEPSLRLAAMERLQSRYLATLVSANPDEAFIDIAHGATRTFIEEQLSVPPLKIGDFTGADRSMSRRASRLMYDFGSRGICAPSAEHHATRTFAVFETHSVSGQVRVTLIIRSSDLALTFADVTTQALQYLGLMTSPAAE